MATTTKRRRKVKRCGYCAGTGVVPGADPWHQHDYCPRCIERNKCPACGRTLIEKPDGRLICPCGAEVPQ